MSDRPKDLQSERRAGVDAEFAQRDAAVERMLSRRADGHAATPDCPDAEVIAAYLDRSLDADENARCEEHFANCSRCQEVLAALTASENIEAISTTPATAAAAASAPQSRTFAPIAEAETAPRKSVWRWLVPVAVAAAALILWIDLRPKPSSPPAENRQVASNAPAQVPASEPATPTPAGPGAESKTNQAAPANRKKDSQLQLNGSIDGSVAAKQKQPGSGGQATRSNAFGNASSASPQVAEALRDESAFEKSAISNAMPTPLPLPGQTSAADQSAGRAGVAGAPAQPFALGGTRMSTQAQNSTVQSSRQDQAAREQAVSPSARTSGVIGGGELFGTNAATILISPANGDMVWRIGPRGRIERSTDSGNTWRATPAGVTADLLAGSAPASGVVWIVGKSGTILRTTDGGAHWTQPKSPSFGSEQAPDWSSVVATDADHATISSLTGQSFITTDGGATWSPQQQ
ncbi:MAG TPA: zf-HC2 domain-containing protein [Candidatus Acidoferrales bacterium]|nr:zf-HC2 domain-containing protein [Candidatus Acidoferrales bacterium]